MTRTIGWMGFVAAVLAADVASAESFGDVRVLATVPNPPGTPEGVAVRGNRVYVAGPAKLGTILGPASAVVAFDATSGALVQTYTTQGEDLNAEHANSCVAFDGMGRLYVLNTQIGMYRIDVASGQQEAYSTPFPDLKACGLFPKAPCSPTLANLPALPNDLVFDATGDAYVTDSMQATIWRVPAGGGAPQVWFQDQRFASPYIGVNGIRLDASGDKFYISVTTDLLARSFIYTLPRVASPQAGDLKVFKQFPLGEAPDGMAFGASGDLYVTLALPTVSGFVVLGPDGAEKRRSVNTLLSPTVPYDSPANLAFDGVDSVFVVNHAFATNLPTHFTVLDVFVGDQGLPLLQPTIP
jgi:sugar lactone lactonase YvrE